MSTVRLNPNMAAFILSHPRDSGVEMTVVNIITAMERSHIMWLLECGCIRYREWPMTVFSSRCLCAMTTDRASSDMRRDACLLVFLVSSRSRMVTCFFIMRKNSSKSMRPSPSRSTSWKNSATSFMVDWFFGMIFCARSSWMTAASTSLFSRTPSPLLSMDLKTSRARARSSILSPVLLFVEPRCLGWTWYLGRGEA